MEPATSAGYLRYIILAYSLKSKEEHLRDSAESSHEDPLGPCAPPPATAISGATTPGPRMKWYFV